MGNNYFSRAKAMSAIDKLMMLTMAVRNMDEIKQFYTEKLGFTVTNDYTPDPAYDNQADIPEGSRWISIALPGGGATLTLTNVFENMQPGSMKLYLSTKDIETAYKQLTEKGVKPTTEIMRAGWGTSFTFNDPDGNQWLVVEDKK
jgi:predicted enzyme related to lactoylglutathione lyase